MSQQQQNKPSTTPPKDVEMAPPTAPAAPQTTEGTLGTTENATPNAAANQTTPASAGPTAGPGNSTPAPSDNNYIDDTSRLDEETVAKSLNPGSWSRLFSSTIASSAGAAKATPTPATTTPVQWGMAKNTADFSQKEKGNDKKRARVADSKDGQPAKKPTVDNPDRPALRTISPASFPVQDPSTRVGPGGSSVTNLSDMPSAGAPPTATAPVAQPAQPPANAPRAARAPRFPPPPPPHPDIEGLADVPRGGHGQIQGLTHREILQQVDRASAKLWQEYSGPSAIAYILGDRPETNSTHKANNIQEVVAAACPGSPVRVSAPQYIDAGNGHMYPFLITGPTQAQLDMLISRVLWSTPKVSFIALPSGPYTTGFVMTVENLSLPANAEGEAQAAEIIRQGMLADPTLVSIIRRHLVAVRTSELQTPESIRNDIAQSVYTISQTILQAGGQARNTLFHVFMMPLTATTHIRDQWVHRLRSLVYVSLDGTAVPREPFVCTYCLGRDHPTGLCPIQNSAFVHKPPTEETTKPSDKKGKPGRGRGRGRGGFRGRGGRA